MSNIDTSAVAAQFPTWESMDGYLEAFKDAYKRYPSMTLEQAHAILADPENAREMSAEDWKEVFENAETDDETLVGDNADAIKAAVSIANNHPIAIRAANLAAELAKDAMFTAFIDALYEKKIDVERGALDTLFHLRRVYKDRLKEFPIVGSKGGNNPDLYQGEYQKADGTKGTKEFSFYTPFSTSLPSYISATQQRELIALAKQKPVPANVPQEYRGKSGWFLNSKDKVFKKKQGNVKLWCVTAMMLEQNLERINSELGTKVKATLVSHKDDNGKEEAAPGIVDCFMVGDWSNGEASLFAANETLNITQFKGLDVDEAKKNGGTFDALMATIKREPKSQKQTGMAVGTFDQLQNAWSLSLGFYETIKTQEQRNMLKAKIISDKAGFLVTVFSLKEELVALCADTDLQKLYARYQANVIKQEVAKAEAEAAAEKTGTNG